MGTSQSSLQTRDEDITVISHRAGQTTDDGKTLKIFEMLKFTPGKTDDITCIDDIITPSAKGDHYDVSDTPISEVVHDTEADLNGSYREICRRPLGRFLSFDVKRSLFSSKRAADDSDTDDESPSTKKLRETEKAFVTFSLESPRISTDHTDDVKTAVQRLSTEDDLIGDGTRPYTLPTVAGKHQDLKYISSSTLKDLLEGSYDDKIDHVTVIDCRYPYEFLGGHIKDAVNLFTHDAVLNFLHKHCSSTSSGRHVLVFHCEFSSERGPKMYRFLRSQDRAMNKEHFPALYFPEVYLLEGGYKAFYQRHQEQCFPSAYTPMTHKDFASDLRHFREKSKSWTAGERTRKSRLSLRF